MARMSVGAQCLNMGSEVQGMSRVHRNMGGVDDSTRQGVTVGGGRSGIMGMSALGTILVAVWVNLYWIRRHQYVHLWMCTCKMASPFKAERKSW